MDHQILQDSFKDPGVELLGGFQHDRLVPVVGLGEVVLKEPVLNRRQLDRARADSVFGSWSRGGLECGGERPDRPMPKNLSRSKTDTETLCPVGELDTQDRIAPECEKVVV